MPNASLALCLVKHQLTGQRDIPATCLQGTRKHPQGIAPAHATKVEEPPAPDCFKEF
jgi:hypothetical protein